MPFVRGLLDLAARQICSLSNEGSFDAVFWLRVSLAFIRERASPLAGGRIIMAERVDSFVLAYPKSDC